MSLVKYGGAERGSFKCSYYGIVDINLGVSTMVDSMGIKGGMEIVSSYWLLGGNSDEKLEGC